MDLTTAITLGEKYDDTVTNFQGTATAVSFEMHGPEIVRLEAQRDEGVRSEWIPAPRLVPSRRPS